jgi:hypothetical protein
MKSTLGRILTSPQTRLGHWSFWLEVFYVLLFALNIVINLYIIRPSYGQQPQTAIYMAFVLFFLACGLAGGIIGLIAVIQKRERSILVWISIVLGLLTLLIILNELQQGIQYMLSQ